MTKEVKEEKKKELLSLAKGFSQHFLKEEYDVVIEKLINKMAKKERSLFYQGK